MILIKHVHNRIRKHKICFRNHNQGCTHLHRTVDILDRYIEIKRCLIADHIGFGNIENLRKLIDKFNHRPMCHKYALRRSGRSGSEITIERIGINHGFPDFLQPGIFYFR